MKIIWSDQSVTISAANDIELKVLKKAIEKVRRAEWLELPFHLKEVLDLFSPGKELLVCDVAAALRHRVPITAINNRVAELHRMGLLERRPNVVAAGGRAFVYRLPEETP